MNQPPNGPGYPEPHHPPRRERTPAWVIVVVIAALCLIGSVVLVRYDANEHDRQVDRTVEGFVDESGG